MGMPSNEISKALEAQDPQRNPQKYIPLSVFCHLKGRARACVSVADRWR